MRCLYCGKISCTGATASSLRSLFLLQGVDPYFRVDDDVSFIRLDRLECSSELVVARAPQLTHLRLDQHCRWGIPLGDILAHGPALRELELALPNDGTSALVSELRDGCA